MEDFIQTKSFAWWSWLKILMGQMSACWPAKQPVCYLANSSYMNSARDAASSQGCLLSSLVTQSTNLPLVSPISHRNRPVYYFCPFFNVFRSLKSHYISKAWWKLKKRTTWQPPVERWVKRKKEKKKCVEERKCGDLKNTAWVDLFCFQTRKKKKGPFWKAEHVHEVLTNCGDPGVQG